MSYINYYDSGFNLLINGNSFPTINTSTSTFRLSFNAPVTVSIDFGNGVVNQYPSIAGGGNNVVYLFFTTAGSLPAGVYPHYVYPDGLTIDRRITVNIADADRAKLTSINMAGITGMPPQFLNVSFNNYPNLQTLALSLLNSSILGLDPSFLTLSNFTAYSVGNSVSNPSSSFYGVLPYILLNKSTLTTLIFGDTGFRLKSFADSNLDKIQPSFPNLRVLGISQLGVGDNHMGDGPLPANFTSITGLTDLSFHGVGWTTIPSILNNIPNYTGLTIQYSMSSLTNWGDLSGVAPRLTSLNFTASNWLPMTLPAWFSSLTSLRAFQWNTLGRSGTSNIDTFISNWYSLIVANALMVGSNTSSFRGLAVNFLGDPNPANAVIPAGTFQQPTGYVQGSSNGSPASSLEMLWVLTNQYGHTYSYRTV